jgi:hypothetical protein
MLAVNDGGHLRRHEELPQLWRLWSSLFPLGEKMIAQRSDNPSVTLPKPLRYFPVTELGLFVGCERTRIEATPLSATSAELGLGLGLGLEMDSLARFSSHALPFFSPPSFHTLSLSPAFTSAWSD